MQFRVDTKALVRALKLVQPGLTSSRRSTDPHVVVTAQAGTIELSTWMSQGHFVACVAGDVEEEGRLAVDYQQLLDAVKPLQAMIEVKSDGVNLALALEAPYHYQMTVQGQEADAQFQAPDDLPAPGETIQRKHHVRQTCEACHHESAQEQLLTYQILEIPVQRATVAKTRLVQMFDQVAWLAADYAYAHHLWKQGICAEVAGNTLSFCARGIAYWAALASEPTDGTWVHRILVDAPVFRRAMKAIRALGKEEQVTLEAAFVYYQQTHVDETPVVDAPVIKRPAYLRIFTDTFSVKIPLLREEIPDDYREGFEQKVSPRLVCETALLLRAVEAILPAANGHTGFAINVQFQEGKLTVSVPNQAMPAVCEVPLVVADGPVGSWNVSAFYLVSMLKHLRAPQVALEFDEEPEQPAVLRSWGTGGCAFLLATQVPMQPASSAAPPADD